MYLNTSFAASVDCKPLDGVTVGNPFLDEGVLDFNSGLFDPVISACLNNSGLNVDYFDILGFSVNPNLGFVSFFSEFNSNTNQFENLGVKMQTQLEYKVSVFPTYNQNNEIVAADLKGYAYSDGHGWLKFSCEKHQDLDFDEDVCDLFESNLEFLDECGNGFGVCINFEDYDFRTKTFGLIGHAFSENLGFIDFNGARIPFESLNLNYQPRVVEFGSSMVPVSNGGNFYDLKLKFYLNGQDKTKEFYNSDAEFCLRFKNNRKLSVDDETQIIQALDCTDHSNLYGSDLNSYNQDAFDYDFEKDVFSLKSNKKIASLVPSKGEEFMIDAVKTKMLSKETFYDINLPLEFKMPMDLVTLPYHINSFSQCDFNNKYKVLTFVENVSNPLSLCTKFVRSESLSDFEVDYIFNSNVDDQEIGMQVFDIVEDPVTLESIENPQNNWLFDGNSFVSDLYFRLDSTFVVPKELAKYKLLFRGSYSFFEDGQDLQVSRVVSSVVDDSRSNYTPLIKGLLSDNFFTKNNDGLSIKNSKDSSIDLHQSFVNKYRSKFLDQECSLLNPCLERFNNNQNVIYLNFADEALNVSDLNIYFGDLVVLDGIDLLISQNIDDSNFIGVIQEDANVYLKTSVTDLNLMLSTSGYMMSYVDLDNLNFLIAENFADYQQGIDESLYNQLYFKGELRSENCFGCSLKNPIVMPDGNLATDLVDSYKAKIWDLSLLRRSPLEFKTQMAYGRLFYQNCDGQRLNARVYFNDLNNQLLCYQDSLNGVNLLISPRTQSLNLQSKQRALVFEYFDFGLPFFSQ